MVSDATKARLLQATVLFGFLLLTALLITTALAQPPSQDGGYSYAPTSTATATATHTATATATATPRVTATPTATPTVTPTPLVVQPPAKVEVKVVVDPSRSVAVDAAGNTIRVTPGEAGAKKVDGQLKVELPMELSAGTKLETFKDEESGLEVKRDEATGQTILEIPVKDAAGKTQAKIVAKLSDAPEGTGTTAEANVEELVLQTESQKADLSSIDAAIGEIEVKVEATLADIPSAASIEVKVSKSASVSTNRGFELAAAKAKTRIKEVAYAVTVTKEGLEDRTIVSSSEMELCVGVGWYNRNGGGAGSFAIFRESDALRREILNTQLNASRSTSSRVCFVGTSEGLSTFALAALDTPPQPTPTPAPLPGGVRRTISPFESAGLTSADGRVTVQVPAGAVETEVDLALFDKKRDEVPPTTGQYPSVFLGGPQVQLQVLVDGTPLSDFRFKKSVQIVLSYTDADIAGVQGQEQELAVVWYNPVLEEWTSLGGTLDVQQKTLTASNRNLGYFSLSSPAPLPTPSPTPEAPVVGDFAPPSWMLLLVGLLGFVLVTSGVYYLRTPRQESDD